MTRPHRSDIHFNFLVHTVQIGQATVTDLRARSRSIDFIHVHQTRRGIIYFCRILERPLSRIRARSPRRLCGGLAPPSRIRDGLRRPTASPWGQRSAGASRSRSASSAAPCRRALAAYWTSRKRASGRLAARHHPETSVDRLAAPRPRLHVPDVHGEGSDWREEQFLGTPKDNINLARCASAGGYRAASPHRRRSGDDRGRETATDGLKLAAALRRASPTHLRPGEAVPELACMRAVIDG